MKEVIILRGAQGSGKSTLACLLARLGGTGLVSVVSADDYFRIAGSFDPEKLPAAHAACRQAFLDALRRETPVVVVDNTNALFGEFAPYMSDAKSFGYRVSTVVVENRHNSSNRHGVLAPTVERTRRRILGDLIL